MCTRGVMKSRGGADTSTLTAFRVAPTLTERNQKCSVEPNRALNLSLAIPEKALSVIQTQRIRSQNLNQAKL